MITGAGEPTLYPGFLELLKAITPYHAVIFDTNLSWSKDDLGRFCREIDASRLRRIQTSFHPLTASKEEFADKLTILRDKGYRYQCRWVAYPPLLHRLPEFRDYFRSRGLEFVVSPYWGEHKGVRYPAGYTPEQGRMFVDVAAQNSDATVSAEHTRQLLDIDQLRPSGRRCRSGCDYACIMPDGRVYRCRQYAMRGMSPLGSFFDEELPLAAEPAVCRSASCDDEYRWLVSEVPA